MAFNKSTWCIPQKRITLSFGAVNANNEENGRCQFKAFRIRSYMYRFRHYFLYLSLSLRVFPFINVTFVRRSWCFHYNSCIVLNGCLFYGLFKSYYMLLLFLNLHSSVLNIWCCLLSQYSYKYLCIFCGSVGAWIDCILFSLTRQQSTCYILPNKFTIMNGWLIFSPNVYLFIFRLVSQYSSQKTHWSIEILLANLMYYKHFIFPTNFLSFLIFKLLIGWKIVCYQPLFTMIE